MTPTEDNTNANRVIITAIADDRPGLVDDILRSIERVGCSIETVSVASLETAVTVMLLLHVPRDAAIPLRAALVGLTTEHNIKIHVDDMPDGSLYRPASREESQAD